MSQPFMPGYGQVYNVTGGSGAQQIRFTGGMTSWCRIKAAGSATIYFNADDAKNSANGLALSAEIFEGPLQARELWINGAVTIVAFIPG